MDSPAATASAAPAAAAAPIFDPYPVPSLQGLQATHDVDWNRIAATIVQRMLKLQRAERVIVSADPYFGGAALDAVRCEIQRAGALELATVLHWSPAVAALRLANGRHPDPELDRAETEAMRTLFAGADAFILLMNDRRGRRTVATSQSDEVVQGWSGGRAVHLHWFHDPAHRDPSHPVNLAHDRVNEAAIVDLDHDWMRRQMMAMVDAVRGRELRLTDSGGSDLRFRAGSHFHTNYGDASRERMAAMTTGRDREEEAPVGSFRFIPEAGSARGRIVFPSRRDGEAPALGRGFDTRPFAAAGLAFDLAGGAVMAVHTEGDQAALDAAWAAESGAKGTLGEIVLGCNPLLVPVPGSTFLPHYGFGAGVVRLILGDNTLSGGTARSSFHRWLMWSDATLEAEGTVLVDRGRQVDLASR